MAGIHTPDVLCMSEHQTLIISIRKAEILFIGLNKII